MIDNSELIKKIVLKRIRLYNDNLFYWNAKKRYWITVMIVNICLFILAVVSLFVRNRFQYLNSAEYLIIPVTAFLIYLSYKMKNLKIQKPTIGDIYNKSDKELDELLSEVENREINFKGMNREQIMHSYKLVIFCSIAVIIPLIIKLNEVGYDFLKFIEELIKPNSEGLFGLILVFFFSLGNLIEIPMRPPKYERYKNQVHIKVRDIFLMNLYLSKLNTEIENETN